MVLVVGIFRIPQSTLTFPLFDEWGWGPPPWPELGDLLPQSWLWFPTVSSELIDCSVWLLVSWTNTNTNFMQMQKISNETFAKMASLNASVSFCVWMLGSTAYRWLGLRGISCGCSGPSTTILMSFELGTYSSTLDLPCWTMLFSCLLGSAWFTCAICSWEDLNARQMER